MTHSEKRAKKIVELNTLFLALDEKGQESALNILRSLDFAQSVTAAPESRQGPPAGEGAKGNDRDKTFKKTLQDIHGGNIKS